MWILSQDKEIFLNTDCVWKSRDVELSDKVKIVADDQENIDLVMGIYSEKRANDIFKEIFSAIRKGIEVYEMPGDEKKIKGAEEITAIELDEAYQNMCNLNRFCKECKYSQINDNLEVNCCYKWLLDNYNVTRK